MTADKMKKAFDILSEGERRSVAGVQPEHFIAIEISQAHYFSHIERRLVEVLDKERRLSGVGNEKVKAVPEVMRGPPVVPAAQHAEKVVAIGAGKNVVDFIEAKHHLG